MLPRRRCPFCRHWYHPHPRLNRRQQTCVRTECRRQQKQKSNQQWRAENPDYFLGAYACYVLFLLQLIGTTEVIVIIDSLLRHGFLLLFSPEVVPTTSLLS